MTRLRGIIKGENKIMSSKFSKYSERFVVSDCGDSSVGIDGFRFDVDVICNDKFTEQDKKKFTEFLKECLGEYFSSCRTTVETLSETIDRETKEIEYETLVEKLNEEFLK